MREINILKEKDMPYFRELEKQGKCVILEFASMEELMDFDLEAFLDRKGSDLTEKDVKEWILEERERLSSEGTTAQVLREETLGMEQELELYTMIAACTFTGTDREILNQAAATKAAPAIVKKLLDASLTTEDRRKILADHLKTVTETDGRKADDRSQ